MERVTFLVDETNERLSCMLNPETVLMRRNTGVRPRESLSGMISSNVRGDNPLLFTGAGHTTVELDLVFDVTITGSSIVSQDVRDLTKPIWDLTENYQRKDRSHRPALCRFIWGKCWNIPGVISAVAERLESFSAQGVPRRSWLRLRLIRMQEQPHFPPHENELWSPAENQATNTFVDVLNMPTTESFSTDSQSASFNASTETVENSNERIDLSAYHITGDSSRWRDIALGPNLVNPLHWLYAQLPEQNDTSEDREDPLQ